MLAKHKSNSKGVLFSKALIASYATYDEFALVNNLVREHDDMKEAIKSPRTSAVYRKILTIYKTILSCCLKSRKKIEIKNSRVAKINKGKLMLLSKCVMCDSKK